MKDVRRRVVIVHLSKAKGSQYYCYSSLAVFVRENPEYGKLKAWITKMLRESESVVIDKGADYELILSRVEFNM